MQELIIDFVNAYRLEKIKICQEDLKEVKELYESDLHEATVLAALKKINLGRNNTLAVDNALLRVPIDLSGSVMTNDGREISKVELVKLLLLTDIDKQVVSHFESELKGTIY